MPWPLYPQKTALSLGEKLGSGAGATVYQGSWQGKTVAVKCWEAETFSDGTALSEWAANRVASAPGHEALVQVLGTCEEPRAMVLELLPKATAAAKPPSFATVTRDALPCHGAAGPSYVAKAAKQIALRVSHAAAYLHEKGLMHGDAWLFTAFWALSRQNWGSNGLGHLSAQHPGDLGRPHDRRQRVGRAPERLRRLCGRGPRGAEVRARPFEAFGAPRLEVRAFGWLLQDLLDCTVADESLEPLRRLRGRCMAEDPEQLPSFQELYEALRG